MSPLRKLRYRLEWLALKVALALIPLLSRRGCHAVGTVVGTVAATFDLPGRRVAESNLKAAFGSGIGKSRRDEIIGGSYRSFARTMLHLLWSRGLPRERMKEHFEIVGLNEAVSGIDRSRGIIAVTFHYGDWEAAAMAMGLAGFPLLIVAQEFRNPGIDPVFSALRERAGHKVIGRERAIVKMYKALCAGRTVAILSDLTAKMTEPFVAINCFGLQACVTFAHAWLHQKTGAPIVPMYCEQLDDGRRRLVVLPRLEIAPDWSEIQIVQACWDRFEAVVRERPERWLWMYRHWRYKPTNAADSYPDYAKEWRKLDKHLLSRDRPARPSQQRRARRQRLQGY